MLKFIKFVPLFSAALLLIGYAVPARAQYGGSQESNPPAQSSAQKGQRGNHLEWLSKELNLTDEQKAKIKPILDDQEKQMQSLKDDTSLSQDQKRAKMMEMRKATHSQINAVLTPDQQKKFAEMRDQRAGHQKDKGDDSK